MATPPKPLNFHYDDVADVITIEGTRYAGNVFRKVMLPVGTWFRVLERHQTGTIEIRSIAAGSDIAKNMDKIGGVTPKAP